MEAGTDDDLNAVLIRLAGLDAVSQALASGQPGLDAPLWRRLTERTRTVRWHDPPGLTPTKLVERRYGQIELLERVGRGVARPVIAAWDECEFSRVCVLASVALDEAALRSNARSRREVLTDPSLSGLPRLVALGAVGAVAEVLEEEFAAAPSRLRDVDALVQTWGRPISWLAELLWLRNLVLSIAWFAGRPPPIMRIIVSTHLESDVALASVVIPQGTSTAHAIHVIKDRQRELTESLHQAEQIRARERRPKAAWVRKICRDADWYYRHHIEGESRYAIANAAGGPGPDAITTVSKAVRRAEKRLEDATPMVTISVA